VVPARLQLIAANCGTAGWLRTVISGRGALQSGRSTIRLQHRPIPVHPRQHPSIEADPAAEALPGQGALMQISDFVALPQ